MMKVYLLLLILIVFAASIRIIGLDSFPPGVTGDEIQQGYTGYSILKTGHDEWGDFMPINPRGFGDYKPPLYAYLTIPSIALFGLNKFAIRLPSAIAGVLTVLVAFFLAKQIWKKDSFGLMAALIFSLSIWHINSSRLAWEANIGALLMMSGLLFFLKSFQKGQYLFWAALFFGLSLLSYHTFKVFTPLLILG